MRQIVFRGRPASRRASMAAVLSVTVAMLAAPSPSFAQSEDRPPTLSTLFEDIYGPHGLVLNSDDVQLDGSNHAAHFNSAFQSEFRLMNVALTSQLATVPLPSPASGFTYHFDAATGTFVRSTRSFGPILAERGETIGLGKIAFGYTYQFFSYDHLDGVPLTDIPAVFTHDNPEAGGGRADVVATVNTIEATVAQYTGALTYGVTDRIDLSLAVPVVRTRLSLLSNATIHRIGTGSNLGVHYFRDLDAIGGYGSTRQYLLGKLRRRHRRSRGARQGDGAAGGVAGARRRPRRAHADRRRAEPARLGRAGHEAVRGVLFVDGRLRAARQRRLPVERQEPHRRQRAGEPERGPAGPVHLRARRRRSRRATPERDRGSVRAARHQLTTPDVDHIRPHRRRPAASRWTTSSSSTSRTGAPPAASE